MYNPFPDAFEIHTFWCRIILELTKLITSSFSLFCCQEIFTVHISSCGKIMFSQVSVCPQVGGVHPLGRHPPWTDPPLARHTHPWANTPRHTHPRHTPPGQKPPRHTPPGQTPPGRPPPQADGHCSGRCVTYWNVFLLNVFSGINMLCTHLTFNCIK